MGSRKYTEEENTWLIQYANTVPYSELSAMFNKRFKRDVTANALAQHCEKSLNIYSENRYQFGNKKAWNKRELYTECIDSRGNHLIKVNDSNHGYINKARFLYEQAHGKVPKGYYVIQLDGNKENFELENLYCISGKFLNYITIHHWYGKSKEITLTAIKLCELHFAMKE